MKKTPTEILFFRDGATAVFDKDGKQMTELQKSWVDVFVHFVEASGYEMPDGITVRIQGCSNPIEYKPGVGLRQFPWDWGAKS